MNDYLGRLLEWAAARESRMVDLKITEGKISKVFIYDFLLDEGEHLLDNRDGSLTDPNTIDLDDMARQSDLKKLMALKEKFGDVV